MNATEPDINAIPYTLTTVTLPFLLPLSCCRVTIRLQCDNFFQHAFRCLRSLPSNLFVVEHLLRQPSAFNRRAIIVPRFRKNSTDFLRLFHPPRDICLMSARMLVFPETIAIKYSNKEKFEQNEIQLAPYSRNSNLLYMERNGTIFGQPGKRPLKIVCWRKLRLTVVNKIN